MDKTEILKKEILKIFPVYGINTNHNNHVSLIDLEECAEAIVKKLTIPVVSQQRELLEGFVDWFNANDKTQAILSERIEEYLKNL